MLKMRSACPINFTLSIFGDKWSLLIVRDMLFAGKRTFSDFLNSDEAIARNILAARLISLEEAGVITKQPNPADSRSNVYLLTSKGEDAARLLVEMAAWGNKYNSQTDAIIPGINQRSFDRDAYARQVINSAQMQSKILIKG